MAVFLKIIILLKLYLAFRTRYFRISAAAAKPPPKSLNELRQLLQSRLGFLSDISVHHWTHKICDPERVQYSIKIKSEKILV